MEKEDDVIQQANDFFHNGLFSEAEKCYRHILENNPTAHEALLGIALIAVAEHRTTDAIFFMQQAAEIAPHCILYRRNLGELLRRAGQLTAAIESHHIVVGKEPHSAENHYLLGLAYHDHCQYELAIFHYHTALSYNHHYGLAWNNLGASLESSGNKKMAKIAYATAVALNPQHAEAQNNLAVIYSEEGRLDEARSHFAAAIRENPHFIDAHYNLSLIKTYTRDDPHLAFLKSITQKMDASVPIALRIRYYFAIGKALDECKEMTDAFAAYAEGNRLHYLNKPWDKTALETFVSQLSTVFTPDFLKKPLSLKDTRCPIFIVGMPRAGTTLIEQILDSHSSIYGAGELTVLDELIQEAHRASCLPFDTFVAQLTDLDCELLGKAYLDRVWKLAPDKHFIIDKMPGNCFYLGLIYRILPHAKIIHAIRDPRDACFSCFTHLFKEGMLFSYDLIALGNYYVLYAKAMLHWQTVLPQNTVCNLSYEAMIEDHETVSKQLLDYIGLPWDSNCLNFYNNDRIVKTASLTQVRKPIYKTSLQRWQHFRNELDPLLQIVAPYRNLKGISA